MARPPWRSPVVAGLVLASWSMAVVTAVHRVAAAAETSVGIVDFAFSPSTVTVNVGDTVVWTNSGAAPHTATSDAGQADSWDSGTLGTGQTFSYTFSTPGTFTYFCAIHPFMRGTVTVRQTATATPTASPIPSATPTAGAPTATREPSATPTPSRTPTPARTPTPLTPTPAPTAPAFAATVSPPVPPESASPVSSGGDVLAASTSLPGANLPSAGQGSEAPLAPLRAPGALASLGAAAGLASLLWRRRCA